MGMPARLVPTGFDHPRPVQQVLDEATRAVDPAVREAVDTLQEPMRLMAGYQLGWWDAAGVPTPGTGGKGVRSALVLLTSEAAGGRAEAAIPAAVAVGLVHEFSLLHDDVMDGDETRRHRPTAWTVFGIGEAILAGDALLALGVQVLAASGHARARDSVSSLSKAVIALVDGQIADLAFESRDDVRLPEVVTMAQRKTSALIGAACALGATFGGAGPEAIEHFRSFGERLGLAFQHVDDLLGIWGDPSVTGKPVHADLGRRKKSLPVVAALASGTPAGAELAELYRGEGPLANGDLGRAAALVESAGGRAWSLAQIDRLWAAALDDLDAARPSARPRAELHELAELVVRRDH